MWFSCIHILLAAPSSPLLSPITTVHSHHPCVPHHPLVYISLLPSSAFRSTSAFPSRRWFCCHRLLSCSRLVKHTFACTNLLFHISLPSTPALQLHQPSVPHQPPVSLRLRRPCTERRINVKWPTPLSSGLCRAFPSADFLFAASLPHQPPGFFKPLSCHPCIGCRSSFPCPAPLSSAAPFRPQAYSSQPLFHISPLVSLSLCHPCIGCRINFPCPAPLSSVAPFRPQAFSSQPLFHISLSFLFSVGFECIPKKIHPPKTSSAFM